MRTRARFLFCAAPPPPVLALSPVPTKNSGVLLRPFDLSAAAATVAILSPAAATPVVLTKKWVTLMEWAVVVLAVLRCFGPPPAAATAAILSPHAVMFGSPPFPPVGHAFL